MPEMVYIQELETLMSLSVDSGCRSLIHLSSNDELYQWILDVDH